MLVFQGDTRVADIFLTEFMRLFNQQGQRSQRSGQALKIGKDNESEASAGVLATSLKGQADIADSLFVPVESAWPVSCQRPFDGSRCRSSVVSAKSREWNRRS